MPFCSIQEECISLDVDHVYHMTGDARRDLINNIALPPPSYRNTAQISYENCRYG
jgi:hypothetical protein